MHTLNVHHVKSGRGLGVDGLGFSSYQLVPARISWLTLFTHTIGAVGHSADTVPVRWYVPGNSWYGIQAPLKVHRIQGLSRQWVAVSHEPSN